MKNLVLFCFITTIALALPAHGQDMPAAPQSVPQSPAQISLSFAPVVKKITPAVVNIYSRRVVTGRAANPFFNDPFFSPFFNGLGPMRKQVEQGLGSGFIVDASGLVVTNAHVIKDATEIAVVLNDGREFTARTLLVDTPSDIGLLQIENASGLPVVQLSSSDTLQVGDLVIAVGNPFGVGQTVTSGIVSALARSNTNINDFDFFIQTDAAINPGNSGGPLVGMDGNVIGMNTAIFSKSGGSLGIGFAIPAEMISSVIAAQKAGQVSPHGAVRPWLGFAAQSMTADIAKAMALESTAGVVVTSVVKDSAAEKAGLQKGDVITAINGKAVADQGQLRFRSGTAAIGQPLALTISRKGAPVTVTFTAESAPELPPRAPIAISGRNPLSGATVITLSPRAALALDLPDTATGVAVEKLAENSYARRLGFEPGDIILSVNGRKTVTSAQLRDAVSGPTPSAWQISIRRGDAERTIILR